jgi:uncharacterized membrane protein YqjE
MAVTRLTPAPDRSPAPDASPAPSVGELIERLGSGLFALADQTLDLMAFELKRQLADLVRRIALLAVGGVVALIGITWLLAALALWCGERLDTMPGGFALVGGTVTLAAVIVVVVVARRLRQQSLVPPATAEEMRRNAAWMKNAL